jgi:hypothetical protein
MFLENVNDHDNNEDETSLDEIVTTEAAGLGMVLEMMTSWENLNVKMMRAEHYAIVNENEEFLVEAQASFWERIKAWFAQIRAKIASFWTAARAKLFETFKVHEKFAEKFASQITALGAVEFTGYKYSSLPNMLKILSSHDAVGEAGSHNLETMKASYAKRLYMDSGEFSASFHKKLRNDESAPVKMRLPAVDLLGVLKSSSSDISDLNSLITNALATAKAGESVAATASSTDSENSEKQAKAQAHRNKVIILQSGASAVMTAMREKHHQAFTVLSRAVAAAKAKDVGDKVADKLAPAKAKADELKAKASKLAGSASDAARRAGNVVTGKGKKDAEQYAGFENESTSILDLFDR